MNAELAQAIDGFLLMLARCRTQDERRKLVLEFATKMVRATEQHQQAKVK